MSWDSIAPLLRHALTFAGGFLVSKAVIDAAMLETVVGAVISLGSVVWYVVQKPKAPEVK